MAAIGEVDEANCAIGMAIALLDGEIAAALTRIQNEMFDCGADIATPGGGDASDSEYALRIVERQVTRLEEEIDAMNASLAPLTSFILPGGSAAVAALHFARGGRPPRRARRRRAGGSRTRQSARSGLFEPPVGSSVRRRAFGCGRSREAMCCGNPAPRETS